MTVSVKSYPWVPIDGTGDSGRPLGSTCPICAEDITGRTLSSVRTGFHKHYDKHHRKDEQSPPCERAHCDEPATAEDRASAPVCQQHAEQDWAND